MFLTLNLTLPELALLRVWLLGEARRIDADVAAFNVAMERSGAGETRLRWSEVADVSRAHRVSCGRVLGEVEAAIVRGGGSILCPEVQEG